MADRASTSCRRMWGWALVSSGALLGAGGCLSLTPIQAVHTVEMAPAEQRRGDYQVDPVDGSISFVNEGLRLRIRHLTSAQLEQEVGGEENPFVFRDVDYEQGFRPQRFTVFQVTVSNPTFDKVLLQPERAYLVTDRGKVLRPYAVTRADAHGDPRNFETYWLSRGVQSGNAQKVHLERMALLRGSIYQRDTFVFKGNSYTGKLAFDPLPVGTKTADLRVDRFVLEFGIYDIPKTQLNLGFPFTVRSEVVDVAPGGV